MTTMSVTRLAFGWVAALITIGCARHAARPVDARAARELRVGHDYGFGGPGPLLLVNVAPDGRARGTVFVRARRPIPGLPDSAIAWLRSEQQNRFARVGCTAPVEMGRDLACPAQFRGPEPDWMAALQLLETTLAADSAAERVEAASRRPIVRPDGYIRIRSCNDCAGIDAEVREGSLVRRWRLGTGAATSLGRLVDSLVARAESGRR